MARLNKRTIPWHEAAGEQGSWFVERPRGGHVTLGCLHVAEGTLTPANARAMATALLMAADAADVQAAEISARRNAELAAAEAAPQTSASTFTGFMPLPVCDAVPPQGRIGRCVELKGHFTAHKARTGFTWVTPPLEPSQFGRNGCPSRVPGPFGRSGNFCSRPVEMHDGSAAQPHEYWDADSDAVISRWVTP
jgi:hypothetical protein